MTLDAGGGGGSGGGGGGVRTVNTGPRGPEHQNVPGNLPGSGTGTGGRNANRNRPGGTTDPNAMSGAEKRANATASAASAAAASRYREQAKSLEVQAKALRHALKVDLKKGLRQQLSDIMQVSGQQDKILLEGYRDRYGQLKGGAEDNEKAHATQTGINLSNQVRERNSALGEAAMQGAGESDMLAAQMMSLRNWNANQSGVQRDYYDTLRSVNSSLTDLNVDTKTARTNNVIQRNADKELLWTNYHNQRGELYTQLGNTRGQQADYYASANEMDKAATRTSSSSSSSGATKKTAAKKTATTTPDRRSSTSGRIDTVKEARAAAAKSFMSAATQMGKSWDNPGISDKMMRWDGRDDFGAINTNVSKLANAKTVSLDKRPEGATLRKW